MQPDPTSPLDLDGLREQCAALEHERWAHWQVWMHRQCTANEDGSLTIPTVLVERWERQAETPYADLSEQEKTSDRHQVDRYWPLLPAALAEAQRERDQLRGARIVSVVFGHHKGAPRPFALRAPGEREPRYLGAQWPDGFVVLQGPNGGAMPWRSAEDMLADFDGVEIVWLSDELEPLAEMEQQRDAARADAERMRPVVEAVGPWQRHLNQYGTGDYYAAIKVLDAAYATYETQEGTE